MGKKLGACALIHRIILFLFFFYLVRVHEYWTIAHGLFVSFWGSKNM